MKYISIITRISMIVLFMSLILSIDNDDATKNYLISAACIISAALTLKLNSIQK
ncbi:MAG: hypothetical protein ACK45U_01825 [bacterium]|jgi:hypothetical protein